MRLFTHTHLVPGIGPLGGMSEYADEFGLRQKNVGPVGDLLIVKVVGALLKQYRRRFALHRGGEEVHIPESEDTLICTRQNLDNMFEE